MKGHCLGPCQKKQQAEDKEKKFFFPFSESDVFIDQKKTMIS